MPLTTSLGRPNNNIVAEFGLAVEYLTHLGGIMDMSQDVVLITSQDIIIVQLLQL